MHTFTKNRQDDGTYLYCVGYWAPAAYNEGTAWEPLRDCDSPYKAAMWVNFLNGGERPVDFLESWAG
jgi:hypothetical protein